MQLAICPVVHGTVYYPSGSKSTGATTTTTKKKKEYLVLQSPFYN